MGKPKGWLAPTPILGAKHMVNEILGPLFPIPPLDELMQYEDGVIMRYEDGEPMEYEK